MSVVKITFDGSSVSSKQDADLNYFLSGNVVAGVLSGLADELKYSVSNNYITFKSGYVQIYGRRLFVEDGTSVYVSLDADKKGYVILDINMVDNTAIITNVEAVGSYPTLTQENLNTTGTRYQFPIAKYSKTTSAITMDTFTVDVIKPSLDVANEAFALMEEGVAEAVQIATTAGEEAKVLGNEGYNNAVTYAKSICNYSYIALGYSSGNSYRFTLNWTNIYQSLVVVVLNRTTFTIPGRYCANNSTFTFYTRAYGIDITLICEFSSYGYLYINTGNSSITVSHVMNYRIGA